MQLNHSGEASSGSAREQIHSIFLWKPKVHNRVHKNPLLLLILSQMNPIHVLTSIYLRSILVSSSHLLLDLYSSLHLSKFPIKLYMYFCLMCASYPVRRGADNSLAFPVSCFPICSITKTMYSLRSNVFTESFPSNGGQDTHTDTQADTRILWITPSRWAQVPWCTYQIS
jgi:hypothetical protein